MKNSSLSKLGVSAVTVSVEIADKSYGSGKSTFMSVGSRLPESDVGLPLSLDEVIDDGLEKYMAAWQTLMQASLVQGEIGSEDYKLATRKALRRIKQVRALWHKLSEAEAV